MERLHRDILRRIRRYIIDDLDVYNGVIDPLVADYILREDDIRMINNARTRVEKAQILLDVLPDRGPSAFDTFRHALRRHYRWLSAGIDTLLQSNGNVPSHTCVGPVSSSTGLPPVSSITVTREEKIEQLKYELRNLEPNGYVVLHGMKGFGKSYLTASTLTDFHLVHRIFHAQIYHIKFGYERPIEEEILIQLTTLYQRVRHLETLPESLKREPLKHSLISFLKWYFNAPLHSDALLILDDVCDRKIIDAFDFNCKTLVLTTDVGILYGKSRTIIEMNDGFTESESLGLFAKFLDTKIDKLPIEAKRIHEECKGMPLLIAMFAAQFEEFKHDMNKRPDRWRYYLNCLRKKDATNRVIGEFYLKQETIFEMCIGQLTPEFKRRYEELAIFSEDVNITPKTLEILWNGPTFQVEEMIVVLCHKSLAVKRWNLGLKSYIYGIHDLLLCYLRKKLGQAELTKKHKHFVEKYRKYCNGDFSKLPEDNYIYSYIGHHLEQAEMFDEFSKLYLNFEFLEAKIKHAGVSDLLIDLKKYRKYITKNYNRTYEERVANIKKFIEEHISVLAEHRFRKCLDLVQIALNHVYPGYVLNTAKCLAAMSSERRLYIKHNKTSSFSEEIQKPRSEEISTEVRTSCFVGDSDIILLGNHMGELILWNCETREPKIFNGHLRDFQIQKIVVSSDSDCFLSLSSDGILKLFMLKNEIDRPVQSPRQKQSCWSDMFVNTTLRDDSTATFCILGEFISDMAFGHDNKRIAGCTNKGSILVWDIYGNTLSRQSHNVRNSYLKKVTFSMESKMLHTVDEANGVVVTFTKHGDDYVYNSQYNPSLQGKKVISLHDVSQTDNSLLIVTEVKAIYVKWLGSDNEQIHSYFKQVRAHVRNKETVYVCSAITSDGQFLVLADSSGFINIWDVDSGYEPVATYKSYVTSLDTFMLYEDTCYIICGSENKVVHRWEFWKTYESRIRRKPLFDALVQPLGIPDKLVIESTHKTVIMLVGEEAIFESEPFSEELVNLSFSADGNMVVYMTEKGIVKFYNVANRTEIAILKLSQPTTFLEFVNIDNANVVVCQEGTNNLKVWRTPKVVYLIEDVGTLISIHQISENFIITVTNSGAMTIWNVSHNNWRPVAKTVIKSNDNDNNKKIHIKYSCLGAGKNNLAILTRNKTAVLYNIIRDVSIIPVDIKLKSVLKCSFDQPLSCAAISQDDQYLAVGLQSGDIWIIDILLNQKVHKLSLHMHTVSQLFWAPPTIDIPLLISATEDELAWWNIALIPPERKKREYSKMIRSMSTPSVSTSKTFDLQIPNRQNANENMDMATNGTNNINDYWKKKVGKDPKRPALLANVELPPSRVPKVCISSDFTKILTVDMHGCTNTFSLIGYH